MDAASAILTPLHFSVTEQVGRVSPETGNLFAYILLYSCCSYADLHSRCVVHHFLYCISYSSIGIVQLEGNLQDTASGSATLLESAESPTLPVERASVIKDVSNLVSIVIKA